MKRNRSSIEIDEEAPNKKKTRLQKSIQIISSCNEAKAKNSKLQIWKGGEVKFNVFNKVSRKRKQASEEERRSNQQLLLLVLLLANPKIPKKKRSIANRKHSKFSSYGGGGEKFNEISGAQFCKGKKGDVEQQMESIVDQAMEVHFEEEILMDILSRLPVRSLLRFKCVSKFWKAFISDPYFKMKHLRHAKTDQNFQKLLITQRCPRDGMYPIYCCPLSSVELVEDVQELDGPSSSKPRRCSFLCCCDGLVIIYVADNIDDKRSILFLWNPSTRESTVLPEPKFPRDGCTSWGMGYDSTSGDYKILRIQGGTGGSNSPSEVLTLKSGSWRKVDKHPRGIFNVMFPTPTLAFVHEAFHWIGGFGDYSVFPRNYCVVSFSILNEVYAELPLPEQILKGSFSIGVSVLGGMLCVQSISYGQTMLTHKLWVLKDYTVKESWNSLFTIQDPLISGVIPKHIFADGEVLFCCCYNQLGNAFRTSSGPFVSWPQGGLQSGIAFTESLISPSSLIY